MTTRPSNRPSSTKQKTKHSVTKSEKTASLTIPKLDLSKAAKFANLPDPYAYLREEEEKAKEAETVIEKT